MPKVLDTDGMDSLLAGFYPLWAFLSPMAALLLPSLCKSTGHTDQGDSPPAIWHAGHRLELHSPPNPELQSAPCSLCTLNGAGWAYMVRGAVTGGKHPKGWEREQSEVK